MPLNCGSRSGRLQPCGLATNRAIGRAIGRVLETVRRCPDAVHRSSGLLDDMRELVRDQPLPRGRARSVFASPEDDVAAGGIGPCLESGRMIRRFALRVDADVLEIAAE